MIHDRRSGKAAATSFMYIYIYITFSYFTYYFYLYNKILYVYGLISVKCLPK